MKSYYLTCTTFIIVLNWIFLINLNICYSFNEFSINTIQNYYNTKSKDLSCFKKNTYLFNNKNNVNYIKKTDYYILKYNNYINNKKYTFLNEDLDFFSKCYYNYNNKSCIKIKNDSINTLIVLHEHLCYKTRNQLLSFFQIGMQNFLSEKTITLGSGKRYLHNNQYIIGYNTFLNIPTINKNNQVHSIGLGAEYRYRSSILKLNSYYNLNSILNTQKDVHHNLFRHPDIGYQICLENKFPYIPEFRNQIKWEQYIYNKKNKTLLDDNYHNDYVLFIGLGYRIMPMLDITIDNLYIHKKYSDTLLTLTLCYQFNIPFIKQITQKYVSDHHHQFSIKNDLYSILEPFIPYISKYPNLFINNNNDDDKEINLLKPINEIIGYPGEIKLIKITDEQMSIKWNAGVFYKQGGKVLYLKNNIYAIYLPKTFDDINTYIYYFYDIQNKKNNTTIRKKQKINITIKNYNNPKKDLDTQSSHSHVSSYILENRNVVNDNNITDFNDTDNCENSYYNENVNPLATLVSCNNCDQTDLKKNNLIPPPPPPMLPLFSLQSESTPSSIKMGFVSSLKHDDTNETSNVNNSSDLSTLLSIHRKTRFSSIEKNEYVKNLETAIIQRKKNKCHSSLEKLFNKLHVSLSQSSIDDSIDTDDSIDNF